MCSLDRTSLFENLPKRLFPPSPIIDTIKFEVLTQKQNSPFPASAKKREASTFRACEPVGCTKIRFQRTAICFNLLALSWSCSKREPKGWKRLPQSSGWEGGLKKDRETLLDLEYYFLPTYKNLTRSKNTLFCAAIPVSRKNWFRDQKEGENFSPIGPRECDGWGLYVPKRVLFAPRVVWGNAPRLQRSNPPQLCRVMVRDNVMNFTSCRSSFSPSCSRETCGRRSCTRHLCPNSGNKPHLKSFISLSSVAVGRRCQRTKERPMIPGAISTKYRTTPHNTTKRSTTTCRYLHRALPLLLPSHLLLALVLSLPRLAWTPERWRCRRPKAPYASRIVGRPKELTYHTSDLSRGTEGRAAGRFSGQHGIRREVQLVIRLNDAFRLVDDTTRFQGNRRGQSQPQHRPIPALIVPGDCPGWIDRLACTIFKDHHQYDYHPLSRFQCRPRS